MTPSRKATINGVLVEEFYWAGRDVVYLDNQRTLGSFDLNCAILEAQAERKATPGQDQGKI